MTTLHLLHDRFADSLLLYLAAAGVWNLVAALRRRGLAPQTWGILAIGELLALAQGAIGLALYPEGARPARGLHLLYGVVAVTGHPGLGAYGGQQALDLIASQTFDLVLLDLMMPEIDGFETLKRLRSMPQGKDLPVVVVTAMPDPDIDQRVASAGANACLRKPVDFDTLEKAIAAHLRHG